MATDIYRIWITSDILKDQILDIKKLDKFLQSTGFCAILRNISNVFGEIWKSLQGVP